MDIFNRYSVLWKLLLVVLLLSVQCAWAEMDEGIEGDKEVEGVEDVALDNPLLRVENVRFQHQPGAPIIDGDISDAYWLSARKFVIDMELYPTRFAKAVVTTDVWIGVGNGHIYLAFNAHDPDPANIRSAIKHRDSVKDDDYVSLVIDPTGKLSKKYEFRINPHGVLNDVLQDVASDRYIYDWNTDYEGAARIYDGGYYAEMAIPFESIKFPQFDPQATEEQKWVVVLKRNYPRRVYRTMGTVFFVTRAEGLGQTNAAHPEGDEALPGPLQPDYADQLYDSWLQPALGTEPAEDKASDAPQLMAEDTSKPADFDGQLVPYYIHHRDETRPIDGKFDQVDEHGLDEVGMDLILSNGRNQEFALTANPNFTEVEADIIRDSINNPFIKQQPEKRRFFLSGFELYQTSMPIVYTRNIGQPEVGASYTYSGMENSAGFFWVNDKQTNLIMPDNLGSAEIELLDRSQSSAFRYQRSLDRQTIGVLGTFRTGEDYHNSVAGVDGIYNLGIDDKMRYQLVFSDTAYPDRFAEDLCDGAGCSSLPQQADCEIGNCTTNANAIRAQGDNLQGHALRLNYKHDGPDSLYWGSYYDIGRDFRSDLGFAERVDVRVLNLALGRKWYVDALREDQGKSRVQAYVVGQRIESRERETIESGYSLFVEFRGSYQSVLRAGRTQRQRRVNRINQSDLTLEGNSPLFDEGFWRWNLEMSPATSWTFNFDGLYGEIADPDNNVLGTQTEFNPKVTYRRNHLEWFTSITRRYYDLDEGKLYREKYFTMRFNYHTSQTVTHRLLYLDDLEKRHLSLWKDQSELAQEGERTLEYTYIYTTPSQWRILAGFKLGAEKENTQRSLTQRELYLKVENIIKF